MAEMQAAEESGEFTYVAPVKDDDAGQPAGVSVDGSTPATPSQGDVDGLSSPSAAALDTEHVSRKMV